jgi:hypothetical protein
MKTKLICSLALMLIATGCGGRSGARNAAQQNYETVDEGSASGVTSTIHGPGETLPPITGTNADTTTNFALNPNAVPQQIPQAQPLPGATYVPPPVPPPMTSASSIPAPLPISRPQPAPPRPVLEPQPKPAEPEPGPSTDATAAPPPPPPATTTTVAPEKPKEDEPPPAPANDTTGTEEPPPPPPPAWL